MYLLLPYSWPRACTCPCPIVDEQHVLCLTCLWLTEHNVLTDTAALTRLLFASTRARVWESYVINCPGSDALFATICIALGPFREVWALFGAVLGEATLQLVIALAFTAHVRRANMGHFITLENMTTQEISINPSHLKLKYYTCSVQLCVIVDIYQDQRDNLSSCHNLVRTATEEMLSIWITRIPRTRVENIMRGEAKRICNNASKKKKKKEKITYTSNERKIKRNWTRNIAWEKYI